MAYLFVLASPCDVGVGIRMASGTWTIGRDPGNSFQLRDRTVSRHHCRIRLDPGTSAYVLDNIQRGKEVWINGHPVQGEKQLVEGDQIALGSTVLRFTLSNDPPDVTPDDRLRNRGARFEGTVEQ